MIYMNNEIGKIWIGYPRGFWFKPNFDYSSNVVLEDRNGKVAFVSPRTLEKEFTYVGEL